MLAGTTFQSTKLPLTTSLRAMYLLAPAKSGIWVLEVGRQPGVNNTTTWLFKHKLLRTMRERDLGHTPRDDSSSRSVRCDPLYRLP